MIDPDGEQIEAGSIEAGEASKEYPALYIMQPIGEGGALEAVETLFFCSDDCRQIIADNTAYTVKLGMSSDWIEGTVCDECGKELSA